MKNNKKSNSRFTTTGVKQEVKPDNPALTKLNYRLAKQRFTLGLSTSREDKKLLARKPQRSDTK